MKFTDGIKYGAGVVIGTYLGACVIAGVVGFLKPDKKKKEKTSKEGEA